MINPTVSVIVRALNAEKTLRRAIHSAFIQNINIEVIAVDDGSTDATPHILEQLKQYHDSLITFTQPKTVGRASCYNIALNQAQGLYVAFLEPNDVWLADKLPQQIDFLKQNSGLSFLGCGSLKIKPSGKLEKGPTGIEKHGPKTWKDLLRFSLLPTSSIIVSKEKILAAQGFNEVLPSAETLDMWLRLAKKSPFDILPNVLMQQFQYENKAKYVANVATKNDALALMENHLVAGNVNSKEINDILRIKSLQMGVTYLEQNRKEVSQHYFNHAMSRGHSRLAIRSKMCIHKVSVALQKNAWKKPTQLTSTLSTDRNLSTI